MMDPLALVIVSDDPVLAGDVGMFQQLKQASFVVAWVPNP